MQIGPKSSQKISTQTLPKVAKQARKPNAHLLKKAWNLSFRVEKVSKKLKWGKKYYKSLNCYPMVHHQG